MTPGGPGLAIGIVCWPTYGGSGVIATEIGVRLAARGHRVHFVSTELPSRLTRTASAGVFFHEVEVRDDYPLFVHGTYPLTLASKLVEVSRYERLDVLHVHYAIPHATAALLARQTLEREGLPAPAIVTTLHGTDITLVGSHPSYLPITRFSIDASAAVTAPSEFLREATYAGIGLPRARPIEVIPNFVDVDLFRPGSGSRLAALGALLPAALRAGPPAEAESAPLLVHNSNFRPLKRVDLVVRAFGAVHKRHPRAALLLVGDGPERSRIEALVRDLGLGDRVSFLGKQRAVEAVLAHADLFLLPSDTEAFGLAALEAQSAGVPVLASRVGGLPEVIDDGVTGLLLPPGDAEALGAAAATLLSDEPRRLAMAEAARTRAVRCFRPEPMIDRYEALYARVLSTERAPPPPSP